MNNNSNRFFWGAIFILIGALFLARNLGFINLHYTFRTYWPLIIVIVGVNILVKSLRRQRRNEDRQD